ncbi:MAG: hypothetical protein GY749_33680 [Desulfobacteraceae bacterium]|nr:hypothetical protein [Desulfobacteraceae bacterium]
MKEEFKACCVSVAYKASFELLFHIKIREWILSDFNPESHSGRMSADTEVTNHINGNSGNCGADSLRFGRNCSVTEIRRYQSVRIRS